ncbi:Thiopurine S-methyltransferase [Metarhizium album ARSEF 1941]|uniref:Thiopurine S-methyltransferase n=1 Tax=Metarhizium album (strain ARSEF 1941) TaxID=1081103 RepID=A0A0B2WT45_METAS|nr:Thiopurine S-methyltransferase [Metarhizium album ARSEF 1941]KHN96672.1 Thiopurine S-methyltransferase [Metarhizium album ARSEF 1941]
MATAAEPPGSLSQSLENLAFAARSYKQGIRPWDQDGPSDALEELLLTRHDLVPPAQTRDLQGNPIRPTALVPGCGRGHDVLLLSKFWYDVVGLDVSPDALRMAEENSREAERTARLQPGRGSETGTIKWLQGDFFSPDVLGGLGAGGSGKFDLIYDYMFLCILPPEARPKWARRMSQLLQPAGHLVCLECPSGKALSEGGPPWGVRPETYEALLGAPGKDISYDADGSPVVATAAKPDANALHRSGLIRPAKTHPAGTNADGTVSDFISVWSR